MQHITQKRFTLISWLAFSLSLFIIVLAWGDFVNWRIGSLNAYQWFPLFGLIAWVTMAEHYYLGALRLSVPGLTKPRYYKHITGYTVLLALILHPGLLAYQQWKVGEGLPPNSFVAYVGETLRIAVMLGSISLTLFLSFEVLERFRNHKVIAQYWRFISISQCLAMILIWVHAFRLGSIVSVSWFEPLWYLLGLALLPSFYVILKHEFSEKTKKSIVVK